MREFFDGGEDHFEDGRGGLNLTGPCIQIVSSTMLAQASIVSPHQLCHHPVTKVLASQTELQYTQTEDMRKLTKEVVCLPAQGEFKQPP